MGGGQGRTEHVHIVGERILSRRRTRQELYAQGFCFFVGCVLAFEHMQGRRATNGV